MSARCSVCLHAQRAAIDATLAAGGASIRVIATGFNVSKSALDRHQKAGHVQAEAGAAPAPTETPETVSATAPVRVRVRHARSPEAAAASPPMSLAQRYRQALRLRMAGLSNAEIAGHLHLTESTVATLFTKARARGVPSAADILGEVLDHQHFLQVEAVAALEAAEISGDHRARAAVLKILVDAMKVTTDVATTVGVLDANAPPSDPDPHHVDIGAMLRDLETNMYVLDDYVPRPLPLHALESPAAFDAWQQDQRTTAPHEPKSVDLDALAEVGQTSELVPDSVPRPGSVSQLSRTASHLRKAAVQPGSQGEEQA